MRVLLCDVYMYACVHACVCACLCGMCMCGVYVCTYVHMNSFCHAVSPFLIMYPVQVAPKVSTSHYTMAVIMYMRVSEEGKEGRGGEGKEEEGRRRGGKTVKEESVAAHYTLSSVGHNGSLACGWSDCVCVY